MSEVLKRIEEMEKSWAEVDHQFLKVEETPQLILRYKASILRLLKEKDPESFYTFSAGGRFGFSECAVNQLMKFAFERGQHYGKIEGCAKARNEILDKINANVENAAHELTKGL